MVNVFIIDDHPAIINGMTSLFSRSEGRTCLVGSSLTMANALLEIPKYEVHVIMLDLYLQDISPIENFKLLRCAYPDVPVVIFSAENSMWWKCTMFQLGVNAYLDKCRDYQPIITTMLQVSDGSVILPMEVKDLLKPGSQIGDERPFTWEELNIGKEMSFGRSITEIGVKVHKSSSSVEKILRFMRLRTNTRSNPDLTRVLIARKLIPSSR